MTYETILEAIRNGTTTAEMADWLEDHLVTVYNNAYCDGLLVGQYKEDA